MLKEHRYERTMNLNCHSVKFTDLDKCGVPKEGTGPDR